MSTNGRSLIDRFGLGRPGSRYWKSLPASSLATLGLAVFVTFSSLAFVSDLAEPRNSPFWWVAVYAANNGIVAAAYALTATRFVRALPLAVALNLLSIFALPRLFPPYSAKVSATTTVLQLHGRHMLDAWLVVGVVTLGYVFFFTFVSTEGAKYFRLRTEIELAEQVQAQLVPPVELTTTELAICGRSIPSSSVGGDLIDAVSCDGSVTCYLADVSGHGIAAGVLMSMVKSAIRTSLTEDESLVDLIEGLNDVLLQLTQPGMFVTLACIRAAGQGRMEYALAGHPPILHYHSSTGSISELRSEQLPIAMFPNLIFESRTIAVEPGDLLAVVSDGFLEVANSKGEEFGLDSLRALIVTSASEPLPRIIDRLVEETAHFGEKQDDQTVLLVRILRERTSSAEP